MAVVPAGLGAQVAAVAAVQAGAASHQRLGQLADPVAAVAVVPAGRPQGAAVVLMRGYLGGCARAWGCQQVTSLSCCGWASQGVC